jgi:hypothetical protein
LNFFYGQDSLVKKQKTFDTDFEPKFPLVDITNGAEELKAASRYFSPVWPPKSEL